MSLERERKKSPKEAKIEHAECNFLSNKCYRYEHFSIKGTSPPKNLPKIVIQTMLDKTSQKSKKGYLYHARQNISNIKGIKETKRTNKEESQLVLQLLPSLTWGFNHIKPKGNFLIYIYNSCTC